MKRVGTLLLACFALGCEGWVGAPPEDEVSECRPVEIFPGARLLTRVEYQRTVRDLLGEPGDPTRDFPPEPTVNGMNNDARTHVVNPLLLEQFQSSAQLLAQGARERGWGRLVDCAELGRGCAVRFLDHFGTRAYRRPLTEDERDSLLHLYDRVEPSLGSEDAFAAVLEAMLASPQFLYRVEALRDEDGAGAEPLGAYELASRLSYFLWGSTPDDELLRAAKDGDLASANGLDHQARRLLDDPRAREQVREFHRRWLGLDRFTGLVRQDGPEGVGVSLEESLLRFLDDIFWNQANDATSGTLGALFRSPRLHVDGAIAPLYGVRLDGDTAWHAVDAPSERHGLLTQPGLLSLLAHTEQSSPITRGVFVWEKLLCSPVPAPPPDVNNTPPDPDPGLTTRERFKVHTADPSCASCHRLIDPVGFGFENYDQLGRYRSEENGLPVDASGAVHDSPDPELEGDFVGLFELSEKLAESRLVLDCLTRTWMTFALGRGLEFRVPQANSLPTADACSLDDSVTASLDQEGNLREVLLGIVRTPAFRQRAAREPDVEVTP